MKDVILTEVAGMSKEGIIKIVDVLQKEVPGLVHQIYSWELTMGSIGIAVGVGMLVIAVLLGRYLKKNWEAIFDEASGFFAMVGSSLCGSIGAIALIINIIKVLKIAIVPKLYLVTYILGLVGSSK